MRALSNSRRCGAGMASAPPGLAALTTLKGSAGGFDPYPVYAALGRLCADLPGFAVSPRLGLGTYPYGKPDMVADVSGQAPRLAPVDPAPAPRGPPLPAPVHTAVLCLCLAICLDFNH